MNTTRIFQEIQDHLQEVVKQSTPLGKSLWDAILLIHPADIAEFLHDIDRADARALYQSLPRKVQREIFKESSDSMRVFYLSFLNNDLRIAAFNSLSTDELTDLFDHLSDEELKLYLNLLHQQVREKVLSMLRFEPESAGGIMDTDVLTFMSDFTVDKGIKILQRLRPSRTIHHQIFVTSDQHRLVGHINLEDLVLQKPDDRVGSFMRKNEYVVNADQDREEIAKKMVHYGLTIVPVVDEDNHFLGVIPSDTLVDIILQEASEDVRKMAAVDMKHPYFDTPLFQLFWGRAYILVALLAVESFSGTILHFYEATLGGILISFIPMLISAGGNTSSQTSAVVIQSMAAGEVGFLNMFRFLQREFMVALLLAGTLGCAAFIRVFATTGLLQHSFAVSLSLAFIVLLAAALGSCMPLLLKRLNLDPAFSAGPFLATIMDIVGVLAYCIISKMILF